MMPWTRDTLPALYAGHDIALRVAMAETHPAHCAALMRSVRLLETVIREIEGVPPTVPGTLTAYTIPAGAA